ncbi:hypothetical protein V2G26_008774 [Clonostachys chloroleuca]
MEEQGYAMMTWHRLKVRLDLLSATFRHLLGSFAFVCRETRNEKRVLGCILIDCRRQDALWACAWLILLSQIMVAAGSKEVACSDLQPSLQCRRSDQEVWGNWQEF